MKKIVYMGLSFVMLNMGLGECKTFDPTKEPDPSKTLIVKAELEKGYVCESVADSTIKNPSQNNRFLKMILKEDIQKGRVIKIGDSIKASKLYGNSYQFFIEDFTSQELTQMKSLLLRYVRDYGKKDENGNETQSVGVILMPIIYGRITKL